MNDDTNPEVTDRLRRFGQQPLDSALTGRHLTEIALATRGSAWGRTRLGRARLSLGIVIGFLAGSTGLAAADLLPDTAQNVAAEAFETVGIDIPDPDDTVDDTTDDVRDELDDAEDTGDDLLDEAEDTVDGLVDDDDADTADDGDDGDDAVAGSGTERHQTDADGAACSDDGTEVKNHGEYVAAGGDPHSRCGKPVQSGGDHTDDAEDADDADDADSVQDADAVESDDADHEGGNRGKSGDAPGKSGSAGKSGNSNSGGGGKGKGKG